MDINDRVIARYPVNQWDRNLQSWVPGGEHVIEGRFQNLSSNNAWGYGKKFDHDRGSAWTAMKTEFQSAPGHYTSQVTSDRRRGYQGPLIVSAVNNESFAASDLVSRYELPTSSELQLLAFGTTAIARCRPANPVVDLPVALAELFREGVPQALGQHILKRRSVSPSQLSGEYLNYQFGLKPFISDLTALAYATRNAERLIYEYAKGSGKQYRRRYEFEPDVSTEYSVSVNPDAGGERHLIGFSPIVANFLPDLGGSWGTREVTDTYTRKCWFAGNFTYYLPGKGSDLYSKLRREEQEIRSIYGSIGLSTAWNLIPFSWAADWVTNVGDVLSNIDAFAKDGLVMHYGYVMESSELHSSRSVTGLKIGSVDPDLSTDLPDAALTTLRMIKMRRRKATPFAFGLDQSDFTNRQWAILAALGISFGS